MKVGTNGLCGYLAIMRGLRNPATARRVAERHSLCECNARAVLREFYALGLVRVASWRRVGQAGIPDRVYIAGAGPDASPPLTTTGKASKVRGPNRARPRAAVISFATLWRSLEAPSTVRQLMDDTGIREQALGRFLRHGRDIGAIRICDWEHAYKTVTPVYSLGSAPDAPRPPRMESKIVSARARANRKEKERLSTLGSYKRVVLLSKAKADMQALVVSHAMQSRTPLEAAWG